MIIQCPSCGTQMEIDNYPGGMVVCDECALPMKPLQDTTSDDVKNYRGIGKHGNPFFEKTDSWRL